MLCAVIKPLPVDKVLLKRDFPISILAALFIAAFSVGKNILPGNLTSFEMAEVEREHKEKLEKEAEKRKESAERAQEEADRRRRIVMEGIAQREALSQMIERTLSVSALSDNEVYFVSGSVSMLSAISISSEAKGRSGS